MKLRIDRGALSKALSLIAHSVPNRPAVPILGGILLDANEDVTVSGFDYEVSAHSEVASAVVAEPGRVVVSGRLLADITRALPPQPVELCDDGTRLLITCGTSGFSLPLMVTEDYPQLPEVPPTMGMVDANDFAAAVNQVAIAAGRDETLPMLTGMRLEFHHQFLRLVATDRFRIAVHELAWQPTHDNPDHGETPAILAPARTLAAAAKSVASSRTEPHIDIATTANRNILGLRAGKHHWTTRLLDSNFAPYHHYLAAECTSSATLDTTALTEAVKRVSLLAEHRTQILLAFTGDTARLSAGSDGEGHAYETLDCQLDGEPLTIAFNGQYLLDGLTATPADRITIGMTTPNRAAIIQPADQIAQPSAPHRELRYVLMSVRLPT